MCDKTRLRNWAGRAHDQFMLIRQGTVDDAVAIAAARVASWQFAYRGIIADSILDSMDPTPRSYLLDRLANPTEDQRIFVAEEAGTLIGFAHCGPLRADHSHDQYVPGDGELYAIYLDPRHMRKGAGRALVSTVKTFLSEADLTPVRLWVLTQNHASRAFYEALGFFPDGREHFYTTSDGVGHPELRYAWAP